MTATDAAVRARTKLRPTTSGCLEFTGYRDKDGYGTIGAGQRKFRVHRLIWEAERGPIPPGLYVLHHCDNPSCSNTAHLFLGTAADNSADRVSKGRSRYWRAERTHCPNGHPYEGENLRLVPRPGGRTSRECVECRRATSRKSKMRSRARLRTGVAA